MVLLGIFVIALYLRTYFPWNLAWPDGLLSADYVVSRIGEPKPRKARQS